MSAGEFLVLFGGIGLFLYGMTLMSSNLRSACGDHLKTILEKATSSRLTSVLAGIGLTVLVQSSSATDVMVIGFVTSGLMNLAQALGVIMGANIGTTITAQITAFNIGTYAPLILFIGAVISLFIKNKTIRNIGGVILGFGMLFEGITLMKSAIAPLAETQAFIDLMTRLSNPLLTILFGILFTALLQSSSSSTVIFQAFAVQGLISYQTAVYLVIGAAVGSVTPNLLAGLTANKEGKRCSVLNLLFNLLRAGIVLLLISIFPQILEFIQSLSPGNVARQIANTHTIFAILAVAILLPFSSLIIRLTQVFIPVSRKESRKADNRRLVYLTNIDRIPPALALDQAHREITRMGVIAVRNLALSVECFFALDEEKREKVKDSEQTVDYLARAIVDKLVELQSMNLSPKNINRLYRMIQAVDDIERISDHAENIAEYEETLQDSKAHLPEAALNELRELSDASLESLELSLSIFEQQSFDRLEEAKAAEQKVDEIKERIVGNHITRLMNNECEAQGGVIFTNMSIDLERCSDHAYKIARALEGTV